MHGITKKPGLSPGTLIHVGKQKIDNPLLLLIKYTKQELTEKEIDLQEKLEEQLDRTSNKWLNMDGIHEGHLIAKIGDYFDIHPLTLEDIMHTSQRPKLEAYEHYLFAVLKMMNYDAENDQILSEQVSFVLGGQFLVSFQEGPGDVFTPVRERLRNSKGRIRASGCDYLAYALIDAVVDNYFKILEIFGDKIEMVEEELFDNPTTNVLEAIHLLKRELIFLRKQVWPTRELLGSLIRDESPLVNQGTHIFFRDVYDHTIQIVDTIETYRDILSGLMDIYLSKVSHRMNEIMKVLTIMATIFIPLTFIAGIYGMNFNNMPELEWQLGYPLVWALMILVALIMLVFFRKKKWI